MKIKLIKNTTLLEAMSLLSPDSSMTTLRSWLKEGRVAVDGKISKVAKMDLLEGQTVEILKRQKVIEGGLEILYADKLLVVIDKPSGLLSVSTDLEKDKTAFKILKNHFYPREVYVVHRLDQDTSGVMIFALEERTQNFLKGLFEKHDIERKYCAVIEGQLPQKSGTWTSYLKEDESYFVKSTPNPLEGKKAVTHYKVLGTKGDYSWIEVTLETGRKNQIRAHCREAGHPVAGDMKYGAKTDPANRLCLHAFNLGFKHPQTYKMMRFNSPYPRAFTQLVKPS